MSEPEARKLASQGVTRERDKDDVLALRVPYLLMRTCSSMASRRTRIASSSLLCSRHDSRSRGPVVIDTGVFAARLTPSGNLLAARYRPGP